MPAQHLSAANAAFNDIIDELNRLVKQDDLDEFTKIRKLNTLEKQALDIESSDRALSYSALGSVNAVRGNPHKMREYHEKSIKMGTHPVLHLNYATSLVTANEFSEALERVQGVYAKDKGNPMALSLLVEIAYNMGNEQLFLEYAEAFRKLVGEEHPLVADYLAEVEAGHELSKACMLASAQSIQRLYEQ